MNAWLVFQTAWCMLLPEDIRGTWCVAVDVHKIAVGTIGDCKVTRKIIMDKKIWVVGNTEIEW